MAFFRKLQIFVRAKNGQEKKWYPRSILVGRPASTEELARRISRESTVSPVDVLAVLKSLSLCMGDFMADGRSVHLDGIGFFYFTCTSSGRGVDTKEEVTADLINRVKVRFTPETRFSRQGGTRLAKRALSDVKIEWVDLDALNQDKDPE